MYLCVLINRYCDVSHRYVAKTLGTTENGEDFETKKQNINKIEV